MMCCEFCVRGDIQPAQANAVLPPVMTRPRHERSRCPLTPIIWITTPYGLLVVKDISEGHTASCGNSTKQIEADVFLDLVTIYQTTI